MFLNIEKSLRPYEIGEKNVIDKIINSTVWSDEYNYIISMNSSSDEIKPDDDPDIPELYI